MIIKLRTAVVVAFVVGLAACGAKKPVASPDNTSGSGSTGGHGYGGTGYGGKK